MKEKIYHIDSENRFVFDILKNEMFKEHSQIFFLAALMGYSKNERKALGKKEQLFRHSHLNTENIQTIYEGFEIIFYKEYENITQILEEYANGGLEEIKKFINEKNRFFDKEDFVNEIIQKN